MKTNIIMNLGELLTVVLVAIQLITKWKKIRKGIKSFWQKIRSMDRNQVENLSILFVFLTLFWAIYMQWSLMDDFQPLFANENYILTKTIVGIIVIISLSASYKIAMNLCNKLILRRKS